MTRLPTLHTARRRPRALLAAIVLALPPFARADAAAPDTLAQRMQVCTACHGEQGRASPQGFFPRIAGKPAGYLYNQLVHFRDGRRSNPTMTYLVEHLTDDYLMEIARYFAGLELPYPPPAPRAGNAAAAAKGEALVRHGDAQRDIPACAACHGAALTGVQPGIPGLLGLPQDYMVSQLGAWKSGQRHAAAPDCMAKVTQQLTAEDVSALAGWIASQPVPSPAHPAASAALPLPLPCGSEGGR